MGSVRFSTIDPVVKNADKNRPSTPEAYSEVINGYPLKIQDKRVLRRPNCLLPLMRGTAR